MRQNLARKAAGVRECCGRILLPGKFCGIDKAITLKNWHLKTPAGFSKPPENEKERCRMPFTQTTGHGVQPIYRKAD